MDKIKEINKQFNRLKNLLKEAEEKDKELLIKNINSLMETLSILTNDLTDTIEIINNFGDKFQKEQVELNSLKFKVGTVSSSMNDIISSLT